MKHEKILIVDDEADLRAMLQSIFARAGYTKVFAATSGLEAIALWRERHPDLIILDVMLPDMDGFEVLKSVREESRTPVIMLTARGEAQDKFSGFESGADDYLVKPFLAKELLLRVRAILNRTYPERGRVALLSGSTVDLDRAEVRRGGESFSLTAKELVLFEKLWECAGRIVTTGTLCEAVCGEFWQGYESTLATHIRHIREKIEKDPLNPVSLVTVKGLGYRLFVEEDGV